MNSNRYSYVRSVALEVFCKKTVLKNFTKLNKRRNLRFSSVLVTLLPSSCSFNMKDFITDISLRNLQNFHNQHNWKWVLLFSNFAVKNKAYYNTYITLNIIHKRRNALCIEYCEMGILKAIKICILFVSYCSDHDKIQMEDIDMNICSFFWSETLPIFFSQKNKLYKEALFW